MVALTNHHLRSLERSSPMTTPIKRARIALNVSTLSDADIAEAIAGIQKVAPQSALMQSAAIGASYSALGTKGAALASLVTTVATDRAQLKQDEAARIKARPAAQGELETLRALVVNQATSASDVTSMGFTPLIPAP